MRLPATSPRWRFLARLMYKAPTMATDARIGVAVGTDGSAWIAAQKG
jgi:hypothetical protein